MNCDHPSTDIYGCCTYCGERVPNLLELLGLDDFAQFRASVAGQTPEPRDGWPEGTMAERAIDWIRWAAILGMGNRPQMARALDVRTGEYCWPVTLPRPSDVPPDAGPLSARF